VGTVERQEGARAPGAARWRSWLAGGATAARRVVRSDRLAAVLGVDLRALAALRVVLALVVLIDLAGRAENLAAHYADGGVLPRRLLLENLDPWRWSVNLVNGTAAFQALVFLVAAAAAVAMLVGWRTRLATVVVWALVVSIQVRNPMLLSGADTLLRVLLFWAMLLPLGAWWSLDRRRLGRPEPRTMQHLSFASAGLLLQIAVMYWFTAILKSGDEWRGSGTALQYAFGARHVTRDLGEYLFQFDGLLRVLTHVSLWLEFLAPVLLFLPIFTGPVRTFAAFAIMAFQLGIMLTFDIGIFPWTSSLCMVSFLPAWFWDRVMPQVHEAARSIAASPWGSSIRSASCRAVGTAARLPLVASCRRPAAMGDSRDMRDASLRASLPLNVFAAFCLVFVLGWNIAGVSDYRMPDRSDRVAFSLGLYQHWNMFAPRPTRATIWFVYPGTLADSTRVDVLPTILRGDMDHIQKLTWEEPDDISGELYGDKYWRKYLDAIASGGTRDERLAFAGYVCRTWNGHYGGDAELVGFDMVRLVRPTSLDGEEMDTSRGTIAEFQCS
jgi:hypothetical protein